MNYRKIIAAILSVVLVCAVAVPASATEVQKKQNTTATSSKSGSKSKKNASDSSSKSKKGNSSAGAESSSKKSVKSKKNSSEAGTNSRSKKKNSAAEEQTSKTSKSSKKNRNGKQAAAEEQTSKTSKSSKKSKNGKQAAAEEQTAKTSKSSRKNKYGKQAAAEEQTSKTSKSSKKNRNGKQAAAEEQTAKTSKSSKKNKYGKQAAAEEQPSKTSKSSKKNKNNSAAAGDASKSYSSKSGQNNTESASKSKKNSAKSAEQNTKAVASSSSKKQSKKGGAATDSLTRAVNDRVVSTVKTSGAGVKSVKANEGKQSVDVVLNEKFAEIPVTKDFIRNLEDEVSKALPDPIASYRINLNVGERPLSYYITKVDKMPQGAISNEPFVMPKEPYVNAKKGMEGDIIAMWHSHGRYYRGGSGWQWQRPFLFETAEDLYTMSYVLPFIVPMLENAGAYVMLPRERDPNKNEVIVDNDTNPGGMIFSQPYYKEETGQTKWEQGELDGFIYDLPDFRDTENPFEGGTYRQTKTIKSGKASKAGWYADIPEDGEYAVYVSYKSLPNSTEDAHYTVNYSGGSREFIVNQTMGGGTWIYLGTFPLEAGYSDTEPIVTLDNVSKKGSGKVITADAVKIGGGMGNIARSPSRRDVYNDPSTPVNDLPVYDDEQGGEDEFDGAEQAAPVQNQTTSGKVNGRFSTSGMPRFVEGARYWLHWAGIPESVYSPYHGNDDYKDDYTSRGHWVNYLAGGSKVLPNKPGLHIPVDLSMALHSDAGVRKDNSIVGTLGIYYTNGGKKYANGTPRTNSRNLTDIIMRQIVGDIRAEWEPNWTRRSMWDKSYLEARVPEVPTTLIELMSHQNFGDMLYGLDPGFRFTVGRAIYKGMGRFLAERKGRQFVVQPLPIRDFYIQRTGKGKYRLSWQPTEDSLEPTAKPDKYIIFERTDGNLGFRKIAETKDCSFELKVTDNEVHSFQIVAANSGGISFPSETLALREAPNGKAPLLIVNGFTRVSAPLTYSEGNNAGFKSEEDFGVPYIRDISFSGHQREFRRSAGNSFGISNTNFITEVVAGNTFDFVSEHGMSLGEAGYGFVSASVMAVEAGQVKLENYPMVDLILGKQRTTIVGSGKHGVNFRTFPLQLQGRLRTYVENGGNLFVSGAFVASDLLDERSTQADEEFASEILGVDLDNSSKHNGKLTSGSGSGRYSYSNTLNDKIYIVEKPDGLAPVGGANVLLQFGDDRSAAAVSHKAGRGKVVTMSVPFETILGEENRDALMKDILRQFGSF